MISELGKFGAFGYHTKPYKHQDEDFLRSREMPYFAFFNEMGTGKSKPILDTAIWLFLQKEIDGLLIVSDKGCYLNWFFDQIPTHMSSKWPVRKAYWSSRMDRDQRWKADQLLTPKEDLFDIMCINIEALSHDRGYSFAEKFLQNHWPMMVVDESTSIKNMRAERTKSCIALGKLAEVKRIATGTPITQSPLDLFAQCEFLQKQALGFGSFVAFKSYYAIVQQVTQGGRWYELIHGYRNLEQLTASIAPFSSRRLKSECLDLPPKVYETVYVEQTQEQQDAYRKLKTEALYQIDSGMVTITSALTLLGKLHQINCGHLKLDGDAGVLRLQSNRVATLISLLDNIPGKVVIWGYYKEDIRIIVDGLCEKFGPGSCVDYYGDTDAEDRPGAVTRFRDVVACRFFVGTPATGGKGLNGLTVASTAIYYSNHYNLERRLQSEDRIHRIGQDNKCTYIDLVCPKTVDVEIVTALKEKKDLATEVLDTIRQTIEGSDNLSF